MAARPRVLAGVPVGGVIAALGRAALLTGTQVDPPRTDLHALLALPALRVPDGGNRGDVNTTLVGHGLVLLDVAAPRVFHANTSGGLDSNGWGEPARRTTARKCHVFPAGAERRRRLTGHDARGSTSRYHPAALPRVSSGGHVPRPLRDEYHVPGVRTPVRARTGLFSGCDVRELWDRDRVYRGAGHSGQRVSGAAHRRGSGGRLYCRHSPRLRSGRVPLFPRDLGAPERRHAQTLMSPAHGAVGLLSGRRRGTIKRTSSSSNPPVTAPQCPA